MGSWWTPACITLGVAIVAWLLTNGVVGDLVGAAWHEVLLDLEQCGVLETAICTRSV